MKKIVLLLLFGPCVATAQDDLLSELGTSSAEETVYTLATFKGTRLGNGHTIETTGAGALDFLFEHRFGAINDGIYEMFGLDAAYVRLGLDYGITNKLSVSINRNSRDKTMDGYLKYRLLRQHKGGTNLPVSVTILAGAAYKLSPKNNADISPEFKNIDRMAYTGQMLIARKFTPSFSFQLMPTLIHKNIVEEYEKNDQFALGMGGRIKLTKSVALTMEYYHNFSAPDNDQLPETRKQYDSFALGIDIETGGHVFQLLMTNAIGLTERAFVAETTDNFFAGDIHLGFNVSRTFQLKRDK
ncbi:MAG: DUF5777 family beta-barrel protein [Cyclobacteriaceae bacterium]|nr:DUF5777 family beta-barrel protein [Cyclobacteriaceae bacterium]MDH4295626.1 DUF5777 family beta-barrel protein [Cyclobacteriaceae bacterium]MDH5248970.1 DUF5777 family beta-barrel protein [Cyclobacteriaceae bacterium]